MGHPEQAGTDIPAPLAFDHLEGFPDLVHGVFTRAGGVSQGAFAGLNLATGCGDDTARVAENRRRVLLGLDLDRAVFLNQVHGTDVRVLKQGNEVGENLWNPDTGQTPAPLTGDGVVTDIPGLALVILVADCQAVVLFDPVRRVVANVHSGWRSSVGDILGNCVAVMTERFSCRPGDILAGISPSLGPCCAEFVNFRREIPEPLWQYKSETRPYFDFWQMSRDQLAGSGLKKENIRAMELCTRCNPGRFFSYRGQQTTGRFGAVIALKGTQ